MKHINRFLIIIFTILLLASISETDSLALAALFAIPLGFLQVLFCLIVLFNWDVLNKKEKLFEGIYFTIVITYFTFWDSLSNGSMDNLFVELFFFGLPVVLAYGVTVFLEKLKIQDKKI
ncbi:hypothetical protein [Tenacibaculum sp. M341]|uniref:hypothetical protein n=1 Tax=Tenacibaculum sp. M341 TaxID=2530339 RepID=UPI001048AC89|nr:hypothetical protein [Tenacibaculum sp. M341]TCI85178.1 hypothetical protein EYW44_17870 [Tenacibaculum sp. M341]